ncbi:MAG: hypothetical protein LC796_14850 [Acidobacteria bacterium]|nr:hypothetical protein [Acidobacteriota bacterium]MCA1609525.1 hypothetical protein [Acidobacteriota bacterium]
MKRILFLVLASLWLAAPVTVDEAWAAAMKANDLDAVMRCYAPDAVAWLPDTLVPKASGKAVTMSGRFSEVAEKRNGRWVYVLDHASAEPAPSAAPHN